MIAASDNGNGASSPMVEAALAYAARGWRVHPLQPRKKLPFLKAWQKQASVDNAKVVGWWQQWPTANVGIATGNGLLVLDVDGAEGMAAVSNRPVPPTPTVRTARGRHLYLHTERDVRNSAGKVGPGIDLRGAGGYIVAPPSIHPDGIVYAWADGLSPEDVEPAPAPSWLFELLDGPSRSGTADGVIPEGGRNDMLAREAGRLRAQGMDEAELAEALLELNQRRCSPPLLADEVLRIAKSIAQYPAGDDWRAPDTPYSTRCGKFFLFRGTDRSGDERWERLSNFVARVAEEVAEDDGTDISLAFAVEGRMHDGRPLPRRRVPASRFAGMAWLHDAWGFGPSASAGFGARDHLRAAIEAFSGDDVSRRVVYRHTGWRQVGDAWIYLHAGGAIGTNGTVPDVDVALDGALSRFRLPEPLEGDDLIAAIRASVAVLAVARLTVMVPIYAAIWRAAVDASDFTVHLSGRTGVGKSELAALVQQHYGSEMDARHLPASWVSTGNALETTAFSAKDALLVVDDFAPRGGEGDVLRLHRDADRLLRSQGNSTGRQRLRSDATLREAKPPRGLILSTGEDIPRGESLRARMLVVELAEELDWTKLTSCQRSAPLFAQALAGFVRWIATRRAEVPSRLRTERDELATGIGGLSHRRIPRIAADLAIGLRFFLEFAVSAGAISEAEQTPMWGKWVRALTEVAAAQERHLVESDPVKRFLDMLAAVISSRTAHLAGADGGRPTVSPEAWGWRKRTVSSEFCARDEWNPQGPCIGWVIDDDVYLSPDASYAAVQDLARRQGEPLPVSPRTLAKRLHEGGFLATTGTAAEGRETLRVRRQLAGQRRDVLHLKAGHIGGKTDRPDHDDADDDTAASSPGQEPAADLTELTEGERKPDHHAEADDEII